MLKLYGIKREIYQKGIGEGFAVDEKRELIATFSSQDNLDEYLSKRLLKNPIEFCGFESGRKFKRDSDVSEYNDYEIEEGENPREIPHDPY